MTESTRQGVLFQDLFAKPVRVEFDGEAQSSDGGALLLAAIDREMSLIAEVSRHLIDRRDPQRIEHDLGDLFRQRVYGIGLSYADGGDAGELRRDPVMRGICNRLPLSGTALGSQPTISRFENAPSAREQVAMTRAYERAVLGHLKKTHRKPSRITIDLDGTDDTTHGQQVFSFFNGFYGSWCFQPLLAFLSFDDDREQYLVHARLRPGNAAPARGVIPVLRRLIKALRRKFPSSQIQVRLDAAYATPAILNLLEESGTAYVIAMAANSVLLQQAEPFLAIARSRAAREKKSVQEFGEARYQAQTWPLARRIIIKAEVVTFQERDPRDNPRFVITNLRDRPRRVYEIYCGRGDVENRIKELKLDLEIDRTSCTRFLANQFRVTMTAVAYALFQQLRARLRRTELQRATVATLRQRLLKIGVRVVESFRRIVFHFPKAHPFIHLWCRVAISLGAMRR